MIRGTFVTIEGIEGSGKSTLRKRLEELLRPLAREIVVTREPGATAVGSTIRNILLDTRSSMTPLTELMLFSADRAQHLAEVVRPALARGALVLCDRFIHSTIAYQGYGRRLNLTQLWRLTDFVTDGLRPDLVLLLDLPAEEGLARAKARARLATGTASVIHPISPCTNGGEHALPIAPVSTENEWSRFEEQSLSFHQRIRDGFLALSQEQNSKIVVCDARVPASELAAAAYERIVEVWRGARNPADSLPANPLSAAAMKAPPVRSGRFD